MTSREAPARRGATTAPLPAGTSAAHQARIRDYLLGGQDQPPHQSRRHPPSRLRLVANDKNVAFMSLERHECDIHVVTAGCQALKGGAWRRRGVFV
jgi:hypothetical protein